MNKTPQQLETNQDEIDLFELWQTIWSQKILIASITATFTIGGITTGFLLPKTYQSEALFLPPTPSQISSIATTKLTDFGITPPTEQTLFNSFIDELFSDKTINALLTHPEHHKYFYGQKNLSYYQALEFFKNNLVITLPKPNKLTNEPLVTKILLKSSAPELSINLLLTFIQDAKNLTIEEVRKDLLMPLKNKVQLLNNSWEQENQRANREIVAEIIRLTEADNLQRIKIEKRIQLVQDSAAIERQYKIQRLESDLQIAKSLNITTPVNPLDYERKLQNTTKVDVSSTQPSRYWLGTKALEQEINNLKKRSNDNAFIVELTDLYKSLNQLKSNSQIEILQNRSDNLAFSETLRSLQTNIIALKELKKDIEKAEFDVFRIIQSPVKAESAVTPKKQLIIAVSILLGGMLAIFTALIRGSVLKRRKEKQMTP